MLLMVAISLLCSDGCDFPSIMVSTFWHVRSFKLHHFCYLHDFFVTYIFVYGSILCLCKHVVLMWAYRTARWNWFFSYALSCLCTLPDHFFWLSLHPNLKWGHALLSNIYWRDGLWVMFVLGLLRAFRLLSDHAAMNYRLPWIIGFLHNLYTFIILFMVVRPLGSPLDKY